MERIMSTRVNESVVDLIDRIATEKKWSKKRIIEEAIRNLWQKLHANRGDELFESSFGAWKRDESTETTIRKSRETFNRSFEQQ